MKVIAFLILVSTAFAERRLRFAGACDRVELWNETPSNPIHGRGKFLRKGCEAGRYEGL